MVVVGDQSSGKSSLLQSLTGIPFPRNLELCTRYATQISSGRDDTAYVEVSIIPGPRADDEHRKRLGEYRKKYDETDDFNEAFPDLLKEVIGISFIL
jgi:conserved oligomeric Golgi complex subunit 4